MGLHVNGDSMSLRRDKPFVHLAQGLPTLLKDGKHSCFRGDIEQMPGAIQRQHIRGGPHRLHRGHCQRMQIDRQQDAIAVAGHEREAGGGVDQQTVIMVAVGQPVARDDAVRGGIDGHQLIERLHIHVDAVGNGVVLCIARLPAQGNRRDLPLGSDINHGLGATRLVGDEEVPGERIVGHAIRVDPCRDRRHHREFLLVDHLHLVLTRRRGVDPPQFGDGQHSMYIRDVGDVGVITFFRTIFPAKVSRSENEPELSPLSEHPQQGSSQMLRRVHVDCKSTVW